jgi:hypothetical protein
MHSLAAAPQVVEAEGQIDLSQSFSLFTRRLPVKVHGKALTAEVTVGIGMAFLLLAVDSHEIHLSASSALRTKTAPNWHLHP